MISLNSVRPFCWFHTYYLITTRFRINNAKISRVIILLSNRTLSTRKRPVYKAFQKFLCSRAHHIILKGQNPVSSLSSHPTAKPSGTAAQFHSTFRSGNPDNPTSIAPHITVSSYTAVLSQCHFRNIIQSIPHTLQHQEISTFRSVTHALVVSQQTHAVMFRLLLFYTESWKIQRGFLQLFPISRCLFTPHFI